MIASPVNIDKGSVLLPIARSSIAAELGRVFPSDENPSWLREHGACFVTLTKNGKLRGCIGTLEACRPLLQDVKENAYAAAFRDPRFEALTLAELGKTRIEVSLLSATQALNFSGEQDALAQLKPGVHGVVFEYGLHRSTFLPQVWEQLPNVAEFMSHLKHKAGLSFDFWAKEVRISTYTVSKWKETVVMNDDTIDR